MNYWELPIASAEALRLLVDRLVREVPVAYRPQMALHLTTRTLYLREQTPHIAVMFAMSQSAAREVTESELPRAGIWVTGKLALALLGRTVVKRCKRCKCILPAPSYHHTCADCRLVVRNRLAPLHAARRSA